MNKNYIFVAGGSGGHVFPAIAVAEALSRLDTEANIRFIGVGTPIERKLLEKTLWSYDIVRSVAVRGRGGVGLLRLLWTFPSSFLTARKRIADHQPKVVIGFGGYPSVIPLLAARSLGIPCVLQEQNQDVGLANKLLSLFVSKIFAVRGAEGFLSAQSVERSSNPVRSIFSEIPNWSKDSIDTAPCIVVLGGSQGAVSLNTEILSLVPMLKQRGVQLIHQSGERDYPRLKNAYKEHDYAVEIFPFIEDIASYYRKAHLLICRAGAMTIAEVSESGRPAIYIPLPIAGGHQGKNAEQLVAANAAVVLEHGPELHSKLNNTIERLLDNPDELQKMAFNAREFSQEGGDPASIRIANFLHTL